MKKRPLPAARDPKSKTKCRSSKTDWPNLYLVGFMGSGKSAVGRRVAAQLKLKFIDSDCAIERISGKSIQTTFEEEGEAAFRKKEQAFVETGHPPKNCVIACGGGLILQPGCLIQLKRRGIVICLHASAQTILERTRNHTSRPLLNVAHPEQRIIELLRERQPIYKKAGLTISADGRTLTEIVNQVKRIFRREKRHFNLKTAMGADEIA